MNRSVLIGALLGASIASTGVVIGGQRLVAEDRLLYQAAERYGLGELDRESSGSLDVLHVACDSVAAAGAVATGTAPSMDGVSPVAGIADSEPVEKLQTNGTNMAGTARCDSR